MGKTILPGECLDVGLLLHPPCCSLIVVHLLWQFTHRHDTRRSLTTRRCLVRFLRHEHDGDDHLLQDLLHHRIDVDLARGHPAGERVIQVILERTGKTGRRHPLALYQVLSNEWQIASKSHRDEFACGHIDIWLIAILPAASGKVGRSAKPMIGADCPASGNIFVPFMPWVIPLTTSGEHDEWFLYLVRFDLLKHRETHLMLTCRVIELLPLSHGIDDLLHHLLGSPHVIPKVAGNLPLHSIKKHLAFFLLLEDKGSLRRGHSIAGEWIAWRSRCRPKHVLPDHGRGHADAL